MRITILKQLLSFIGFLSLSLSSTVWANQAPSFTLPGQTSAVSLEQHLGSVVYIDFWASWCGPCRKSFPWMNKIQKKYKSQGLTVIAINLDESKEAALAFLKSMDIDLTIAFDPEGKTAQAFNVVAMPSSYVISRDGKIVHKHMGFRSKDKHEMESTIQQLLEIS